MSIVIREAHPGEYDDVARITRDAYQSLFGVPDLGDYGDQLVDVGGRAEDSTILVALVDDRVIGGVTYVGDPDSSMVEWPDRDVAGFRMLAVDPAVQGTGAGRALTHACLDRARAEGHAAVVLHTTKYMERARGMYERLGFVRYEAIDHRYDRVEIIGYRLELREGVR